MLPKEWERRLIDENVRPLTDADIQWADYVFISAMTVQTKSSQEIIDRCNSFSKPVVAGGPLFTTEPDIFKGVSHYVLNEAEITLPLFLKDLELGNLQREYISNTYPDLNLTPIPDWSLINFKDYSTMMLQFSRGCPRKCDFCDVRKMFGQVPRTKTNQQFINELQSLYGAGWRGGVFIVDDNFIGNKIKVRKLLLDIIIWQKAHGFPFKFSTEADITLADDDELLDLMVKANFYKVFVGIETPHLESLKECNKRQNTHTDLMAAVKKINTKGLQVLGGFIVGFDNDPENIFSLQKNFIQNSGIVTAMVGLLNVVKNTELYFRLRKEGRLVKTTGGEQTNVQLDFVPKMPADILCNGYRWLIEQIYSPKPYYQRIHTFLKHYNPTVKGRLSLQDVKAVLLAHWKIGMLSQERWLYWWLIIKTAVTKTKALPEAIEHAIIFFDFARRARAVCEK
jgi:radical SAM superfamily enzyme YgiQ (UPF0313 family)